MRTAAGREHKRVRRTVDALDETPPDEDARGADPGQAGTVCGRSRRGRRLLRRAGQGSRTLSASTRMPWSLKRACATCWPGCAGLAERPFRPGGSWSGSRRGSARSRRLAGCLEAPPEGRGQSLLVSDPIRAAGGIVRRRGDVLVVHRPKYGDWTFPKGKAKRGETDEECALREVEEETGLRCLLGRELVSTRYRALAGPKVVRYWRWCPSRVSSGPAEVDEVRWLPPRRAAALLSYGRDGEVLRSLGPPPLLFVRHGSAGDREQWVGDDRLRPLDEKGRRQAAELVTTLEPYAVERVLSSPFVHVASKPWSRWPQPEGLEVETTEV